MDVNFHQKGGIEMTNKIREYASRLGLNEVYGYSDSGKLIPKVLESITQTGYFSCRLLYGSQEVGPCRERQQQLIRLLPRCESSTSFSSIY